MAAAPCPTCGVDDLGKLFCLNGHVTTNKVRVIVPTHKIREFFDTGDPAVFAAPGAPDYRGG